ncbi:TetR family transcriptional regulator [Pseudomonas sp. ICMP 8385]|uniref:TetR family transcriptional regulator n=2 Tax=Pseudomonas TaxID=286 RepID=A0A7Y1MUY8_9PSED|nr:TetR family transcriptional regulator [Pseudomonas gessardii]PHN61473.1 TetR family transcriptional regulator [Pseudomonas sp. ICMP 8385]MCF4990997.1 TetR family transcriptional regulator [Pseudomonas gessardii]MCF5086390.1 TetR family transcriptional regulator [Pseudomonas gessardii]MCF5097193.1 TetR family transcriptional regulator [Pseudomonas gessardii]
MAERGRPRAFDRGQVLEQAMDVFWLRGYEGASLTALTQAMEINPPSLYAAFKNKEGLFRAALDHYLTHHGAYRYSVLADAPTAREGVQALLKETVARFYHSHPPRGCLVVLAALSGTPESQLIQDELSLQRRETHRLIEARIRRGLLEGDVPVGTNIETLSGFYTTVMFGLSVQAKDQVAYEQMVAFVETAMGVWPPLSL